MLALTASLFLFLAIATGALVLFSSGRGARGRPDERLRELAQAGSGPDAGSASPTLKRPPSSIPFLRHLLTDSSWAESTSRDLQQANVHLRVGEYLLIRSLIAAVLLVLPILLSRAHPAGIVIGIVLGAVGYVLPQVYLKVARRHRIDKLERQLVELAPLLASALRSGFAMQQGLELAARQLEAPLADELTLLLSDINLGATMETALQDFGNRLSSQDFDMLITAILIQRSSGGNLAEVLDQTAETLRERERIRGDVKTLTASQRFTGVVLSIYPAVIGLLLLTIMPSMWSMMFTKALGQILLGFALGLQLIGFVAIRRLMDIPI